MTVKAIEKSTKNESSVRTIYLDDETIDIIKQWRNFYLKEQSQFPLTKLNISNEYMFSYISSNDKIEPLHADYINNVLNRIIKKHKLKPISPHGFRHTHATLMSEIGIDPSNTSKRLGHASSQVTLDVYTHTTKTVEKNSIDKFADYLNKANRIMIFKILKRLSEGYHKAILAQNSTKSTLQNLCKVL